MDTITVGILVFEGVMFLAVIAILIFLVIQRIEEKAKETFEQRDN